MDACEKIASQYLKTLFASVLYEPDGNVPPDFVCDNSTAVEVRRLNQNEFTSGKRRGLEETSIPLVRSMQKLLASMPRAHSSTSWFVTFSYLRPLPEWRVVRDPIKQALVSLDPNDPNELTQIPIHRNLSLTVLKSSSAHQSQFVFGGHTDFNTGGFVAAEVLRNAQTCIVEKTASTAQYRSKYPFWWLLLVDVTGLFPGSEERELVRTHLNMQHNWDRILVVHPGDPKSAWEI